MAFSIKGGGKIKRAASVPGRTPFVLGSRPPDLRAPPVGGMNIKPQPGSTTQYGKTPLGQGVPTGQPIGMASPMGMTGGI